MKNKKIVYKKRQIMMNYIILKNPIIINNIPEIIDQILSGRLLKLYIFWPNEFPKLKKNN